MPFPRRGLFYVYKSSYEANPVSTDVALQENKLTNGSSTHTCPKFIVQIIHTESDASQEEGCQAANNYSTAKPSFNIAPCRVHTSPTKNILSSLPSVC